MVLKGLQILPFGCNVSLHGKFASLSWTATSILLLWEMIWEGGSLHTTCNVWQREMLSTALSAQDWSCSVVNQSLVGSWGAEQDLFFCVVMDLWVWGRTAWVLPVLLLCNQEELSLHQWWLWNSLEDVDLQNVGSKIHQVLLGPTIWKGLVKRGFE